MLGRYISESLIRHITEENSLLRQMSRVKLINPPRYFTSVVP